MHLDLSHICTSLTAALNRRLLKLTSRRLALLIGVVLLMRGLTTYAQAHGALGSVFPTPGLTNPRMNFNLGTRVNGVDISGNSPYLPAIPGPLSGWTVTMWHRRQVLNARDLVANDQNLSDSRLGPPIYAFVTPDHNTHLAIFRAHKPNRWVYELFEKNGRLLSNGCSRSILM